MVEEGGKMNKLTILEINNNYAYILKDEKNNKYSLNLEFMNLEKEISVNDLIYMSDELIKEAIPCTFGPLGAIYGKKIESEMDKNIVILEINNEKIYLQRYYG
jgi:hypothetical protein